MSGVDDIDGARRSYKTPYNPKHKIPTIQEYRSRKANELAELDDGDDAGSEKPSWSQQAYDYWTSGQKNQTSAQGDSGAHSNHEASPSENTDGHRNDQLKSSEDAGRASDSGKGEPEGMVDTTQASRPGDPKAKRKQVKHSGRSRTEREVTDPVTHLPVTIHDYTDKDLEDTGEAADDSKFSSAASHIKSLKERGKTATGSASLDESSDKQWQVHRGLDHVFPPPEYDAIKLEMSQAYHRAMLTAGIGVVAVIAIDGAAYLFTREALQFLPFYEKIGFWKDAVQLLLFGILPLFVCAAVVMIAQQWVHNKVSDAWEDEIWFAQRQASKRPKDVELPESTHWLNMLVASIWPLINPDLFSSLADTLEDVMQASLPTLVRMISVDDIGQGSEPFRFLGMRWLPKGAAGRTVTKEGHLESSDDKKRRELENDRKRRIEARSGPAGQQKPEGEDDTQPSDEAKSADDEALDGLKAEEGEFVNMEIAFAYRANNSRAKFRERVRNAHLLLNFYLPGNIKLPVWVELRGIVGSLRVRMQLTPDPPFIALSTITLLGQPKVNLSCIPLAQKGLNIMDIPLISNFVQSAIDAALSEYVAPKSLTLDLKAMLSGDDFKKDTWSKGVLVVRIKRAFDFKEGDSSIPLIKEGSSDAYVSVGWAKFGKPLWSTRVIIGEMEPYWQEETFLLVSPEELDADESLRVQLWDSDRFTADDDLGRIELNLKSLMQNDKSNGRMWDRTDAFEALAAGESMPGRCEWSVGYFSKVRLQDWQVKQQKQKEHINTLKELKQKVYHDAERKLRETTKDESEEVEQQKRQDLEEMETEMTTATTPDTNWPCGILSVQIHQIVGLEVQSLSRSRENDGGEIEGDEEESESLPSSYCTIIINHAKVFKTRTKPKNSKPFFNASTERFIRDWRSTSVIISVRDARLHEDDPLLGVVALPIAQLFRNKNAGRFNEFFPLAGGIGYGRIRVSVVFRSIALEAPMQSLGWDYGTLVIKPEIISSEDLPSNYRKCRLRLSNQLQRGKMHPISASIAGKDENNTTKEVGHWIHGRRNRRVLRIAVRNRYSSHLLIEFRPSSTGLFSHTRTEAYAILWLSDIADSADQDLVLPVHSLEKDHELLARASANVLPEDQRGEKIGTITIKLKFERGLSDMHAKLARRNPDIGNVVEVLGVVKDFELSDECLDGDGEQGGKENIGGATGHKDVDSDTSSSSSDSESSDEEAEGSSATRIKDRVDRRRAKKSQPHNASEQSRQGSAEDGADAGEGSITAKLKNYKQEKDQLHRSHRGMMQWKGPRTAQWIKNKAEHVVDRIEDGFSHKEREPKIETEV